MSGGRSNALSGSANLDRALRLREEGWSYARIGAEFGCSEAGASNAIITEQARRAGRYAKRDATGHLLPCEKERLRLLLKRGVKPVEIQRAMGLSASRIAEERRRYNADLKARGKALLPPPGNGEAYCGAPVPVAKKREVERLFLEGFGNQKIHKATGVSITHIGRIRSKLVKRLKRKGECLPGCDLNGKRRVIKDSVRYIPEASKERLRQLLLERVPVSRAAQIAGVGSCSAYRIRDALKAEMEARGESLLAPIMPGKVKGEFHPARRAAWLKPGDYTRFRELIREHGEEAARSLLKAEYAAEREAARRADPFAYQLEQVRAGRGLVAAFKPSRASPTCTLGGVSSLAAAEAA